MEEQKFVKIRKTLIISLVVCFLILLTAAAVSAAKVIVYQDINFVGEHFDATHDMPYVGNYWNDKISSIKVESGTWRFYQDANYGGSYWDLGPGDYPWVEDVGIPNDVISSFKQISNPEVIVYQDINFGGEHFDATNNIPYVGNYWNDKISSIKVKSGTWRFYQDANYGGSYWDLGPGDYSWVEDVGIPNDVISSFKHI
jgi:Beta/Gamma crystallin